MTSGGSGAAAAAAKPGSSTKRDNASVAAKLNMSLDDVIATYPEGNKRSSNKQQTRGGGGRAGGKSGGVAAAQQNKPAAGGNSPTSAATAGNRRAQSLTSRLRTTTGQQKRSGNAGGNAAAGGRLGRTRSSTNRGAFQRRPNDGGNFAGGGSPVYIVTNQKGLNFGPRGEFRRNERFDLIHKARNPMGRESDFGLSRDLRATGGGTAVLFPGSRNRTVSRLGVGRGAASAAAAANHFGSSVDADDEMTGAMSDGEIPYRRVGRGREPMMRGAAGHAPDSLPVPMRRVAINQQMSRNFDPFDNPRRIGSKAARTPLALAIAEGRLVGVSGLDYSILQSDLEELLSAVGPIEKCWIDYDRTDRSLGTGGVIFASRSHAHRAIQVYNGRILDSQPVHFELITR